MTYHHITGLNDAEHADLQTYARDLADRLGLKDWEVTIDRSRPPGDALAYVHVQTDVHHSLISVGDEFRHCAPEQQRELLTHELLHAHHDRIDTHIMHVQDVIGGQSLDVLRRTIHDDIEQLTDRLARAIAPLLPLPGSARATLAPTAERDAGRPFPLTAD